MPENPEPPDADALANAAARASRKGPPPVHLWNPPFCGDLDMRIAVSGDWFYLGAPIRRPEMVRLFASVLRRDGEDYFLVTPVEKVRIKVDDAPFVAVDMEREGDRLVFVTNTDDAVAAGPEHPIRVESNPQTGEPRPYVLVRARLEALIDRKTFHRMAALGEVRAVQGVRWFGVASGGAFFPIQLAAELDL